MTPVQRFVTALGLNIHTVRIIQNGVYAPVEGAPDVIAGSDGWAGGAGSAIADALDEFPLGYSRRTAICVKR